MSKALPSILAGAALAAVCLLVPRPAQAAEYEGYICSASFVTVDTRGLSPQENRGALGYVTFDVYTDPHCEGRKTFTGYYCSVGATSTRDCYPFSLVSSAAALAEKETLLVNHAMRGARATVYTKKPKGPMAYLRLFASN
ncbi:MAG: hypothetical protein AAF500_19145 [Myxococcota bacterium]